MNTQNSSLVLFLVLGCFLSISRPASADIELVSTPSIMSSADGGAAVLENTRFQFSSDEKPVSFHFSGSALDDWRIDHTAASNAV
jgi:hypothetical protein